MSLRIVTPANDEEWRPFDRVIAVAFGDVPTEPDEDRRRRQTALAPFGFRIGIADGDVILGGCSSFEVDLTLPGGALVPVAALTGVGIDPSKGGRGGFRLMMEEHLRRARDRGHAGSILNASESSLYGRFGYGSSTDMATYEIDSGRAGYRRDIDDPGSIDVVADLPGAVDDFADIYRRVGDVLPGTGSRSAEWWENVLGETRTWMGGGKNLAALHRSADGTPDGYLIYAYKGNPSWVPSDEVVIKELMATDLTAELALFRFACSVPLTRSVRWSQAPLDPVVRHHLADPRQLRIVDAHDLLWLRPLDVPRLLAARSYLHDVEATITIADELFPDQRGPWRVVARDGSAKVEPAGDDAPSDVTLRPDQLAMVLLGNTGIEELAVAGVIDVAPDVVARLHLLFRTDRRPFNLSKF